MKLFGKYFDLHHATEIKYHPMPFIIGASRSGTTLLRFMLDSHPLLAIPPETGFLTLAPKFESQEDHLRKNFYNAIMNYPKDMPVWPDFSITSSEFEKALDDIEPFTISEGYRAFYKLYAKRFGKSRWGDKTPMYCLHLDTIRNTLPEARFVHIIRDGRDVALSLRKQWFSPGPEIETQAEFWKKRVQTARLSGLGHPDYIEIRYEELIQHTREALQEICSFIDLDFCDEMLEYSSRAAERIKEHQGRHSPDGTEWLSKADRIKQQWRSTQIPDPSCVFMWKSVMSQIEQEKFKKIAGDLLNSLGYET